MNAYPTVEQRPSYMGNEHPGEYWRSDDGWVHIPNLPPELGPSKDVPLSVHLERRERRGE